jgi:hypothetical protein
MQPYTLVAHLATSPVAKNLLSEAASLLWVNSDSISAAFATSFQIELHLQQRTCFARAADKSFLTLSLIARGELSNGVVEAGGDFAKRLPSANGVVVGS